MSRNENTKDFKWQRYKLGDIVYKISIKALPKEFPDMKFIGMDCIESNSTTPKKIYKFSDFKSAGNLFDKNHILYGRMRPYLNKVYKAEFKGVCSGEFIVLESNNLIEPEFLKYILHSQLFVRFANGITSGDRPRISFEEISEYNLSLPSIELQQVLVNKIEELFSELDKGIENLRLAQQQLKTYRQAVLTAGTSGVLTKTNDTFNNIITIGLPKKSNKNWETIKLTDVAKLESGHTPRKDTPAYWENGNILWLSLQDIRALDGKIAFDTKYKTNRLGIENSSARLLPPGTVCFCRDISVGYVTIMGKEMSTTQHFANWICSPELNNKFLMYAFMASRDSLIRQGQGTTVKTIYMPDLKEMRIQLPPIEEQNMIIKEIECRLSNADKLEESMTQSLQQSEGLRQSILKKAFQGRLV